MRRSIVTSPTDSLPSRTRVRWSAAPLALAAGLAGCSAGSGEDNFNPSGGSGGSGDVTSTSTATDAAASASGSSASGGTGTAGSMSGSSTATATDPTAGTGTATSAASASASGSDTDVRFDVGETTGVSGASGIDTQEDGCKKVDVILAVDNSNSMQEEIDELRGSVFNTLPTQLLEVGNGGIEDFHLGVIDACPKPARLHNWGASGACNFATGQNYMASGSATLVEEFECVSDFAERGYNNEDDDCLDPDGIFRDDDEQPAMTGAAALTEAANAGFLRTDAILFVFAITDEDEELSGASNDPQQFGITPAEMAAEYIAGKGGRAQDVVFLGVGGGSDCEGPYGGADNARELRAVVDALNAAGARASFWDLCQGDLPGAFASVITDVDQACDEFVPPG